MKSPLNYLGGKSRLAERIVNKIPEHTCYCEPFSGAAWVLFRKDPSSCEVINDADGELVTFWRVIQNHLEEFLRYYKYAIISREIFDLEKDRPPRTLTDIQRATRYYYLQKLGFGGRTTGRTFGVKATSAPGLNLSTMEDVLLETHWRLKRVVIEHLDALACIKRYDRPTTFFYMDPPYCGTAGYAVPFPEEKYSELAELLATLKGKFICSLNDTPQVRATFKAFRIRGITTTYTVKNGRSAKHNRDTPAKEVLIDNIKG